MSSVKLHKKLVKLDFRKDEYFFVDIKIIALGFNDLRMIVRQGKLGNKGRESTTQFNGKDSFKNAIRSGYSLEEDFLKKGYVSRSRVVNALKLSLGEDNKLKGKKNNKGTKCYFCDKYIDQVNSRKIKKWADTEGNWNYSKKSPLYNKIVCIDCQIEKGIYQTSIDKNFKLED